MVELEEEDVLPCCTFALEVASLYMTSSAVIYRQCHTRLMTGKWTATTSSQQLAVQVSYSSESSRLTKEEDTAA